MNTSEPLSTVAFPASPGCFTVDFFTAQGTPLELKFISPGLYQQLLEGDQTIASVRTAVMQWYGDHVTVMEGDRLSSLREIHHTEVLRAVEALHRR